MVVFVKVTTTGAMLAVPIDPAKVPPPETPAGFVRQVVAATNGLTAAQVVEIGQQEYQAALTDMLTGV